MHEHGPRPGAEADALAWQVAHLDLRELARAIGDWARRLPAEQRRALLLKLSSAAAVAAGRSSATPPRALGRGPATAELAGPWDSRYTYVSTGRGQEFEGTRGSWTECTASDGYYRGAVYHGVVQFVLDPTGRSMAGRWLGPDRHFVIASGRWVLERAGR